MDKKIKKSISKAVKYLRKYRLRLMEIERKDKVDDGGVSIIMSYLQGRFGIDFGFKENCRNLYKCARKYRINHPKSLFDNNVIDQDEDLFSTNFLQDIYFQKTNQYPLDVYLDKLERYLMTGDGYFSQLLPIMDIFSQKKVRTLNVALALFGLQEKRPDKTSDNHRFNTMKKNVIDELVKIFDNDAGYDPYYLDTVKAYSLVLMIFFDKSKLIKGKDHTKFINCLIKNQASNGQWYHADNYDSVSEINNLIITVLALTVLLDYYENKAEFIEQKKENKKENPKQENKQNIEEGFQGGFLTPRNMDQMWGSPCASSMIELIGLIIILILGIYLGVKFYQKYNL